MYAWGFVWSIFVTFLYIERVPPSLSPIFPYILCSSNVTYLLQKIMCFSLVLLLKTLRYIMCFPGVSSTFYIGNILNKAIAMMRGRSAPSEHVLEKIKYNNSLGFKEDLERDTISFFCQNIILFYLLSFF